VVVSGHWEEPEFSVTGHSRPPLIYDYYGFPEHTYQLKYDAPGSPVLASQICELLGQAGIAARSDPQRGLDHGVFVPFKMIYPHADVPIVQLSLKAGLDPATHIAAGRALQSLREQGVLVAGSGMSYHNMRGYGSAAAERGDRFDAWLTETVEAANQADRSARLCEWVRAPSARDAHPREEHLLPLMVAAGAAAEDLGRQVFSDRIMGAKISAFRFG
jgi:aromatic ring-opening dioxygenase catalytic subunit (LigB family)